MGIAAAALALSFAGERAGRAIDERRAIDAPRAAADAGLELGPRDAGSVRLAPDGAILAPPIGEDYACVQPELEIPREPACDEGRGYPRCRWQVPDTTESRRFYRVWRSTTPDHR